MPDGRVKHFNVLARALKTSSGDLEFVGAVIDVTEASRQKIRSGKAKTSFVRSWISRRSRSLY